MNDSLVVPHVPTVWPQALDITQDCGPYQIQAVLAAYGQHICIATLRPPVWARGYTLPYAIPALLKQYGGLVTKTHYGFGAARLMELARHALGRGHPLIVLIRATRGEGGAHWISIWGYDAPHDVFLVYDSQYASRMRGIGNTTYAPAFLASRLHRWIRVAVEIVS